LLLLLLPVCVAVAKGDRIAQLVLECIVTPDVQ
jgi:dUTPase